MKGETVYVVERIGDAVVGVFEGRDLGAAPVNQCYKRGRAREVGYARSLWPVSRAVYAEDCTTRAEYERWQAFLDTYYGGKRRTTCDLDYAAVQSGRWQPERAPLPADDEPPAPCEHGFASGEYCVECD